MRPTPVKFLLSKLNKILNKLTDIWQVEVGADSFSSLISVQIEGCKQLNKVFFPSHMTGWFGSLDSLKVIDCMSVEVIFEIKDFQPDVSMKVQTCTTT